MDLPDARLYIVGLLVDCPYEPNPADCALHHIRKKPLKERTEWSKRLTDEQIQHFISIHKQCLTEKEDKNRTTEE
jgi:hypothetical protein